MKNKNNNGFSLIELLVVIIIIALISTIFLIGFRGGEEQFALQRSAHLLVQDLRQAQELAMRAEDFDGSVSRGGFGIHLESATSSYILFADCDQDGVFDVTGNATSCVAATDAFPFPEELKIEGERRKLEQGIKIKEISLGSFANIVFVPPDPITRISGEEEVPPDFAEEIKIILKVIGSDPPEIKIINVNKAGLIAIE